MFYWKIVAKTLFILGLLLGTGSLLPQTAFAEMSQAVVTPDTMPVDLRNKYAFFYEATRKLPGGMEDISGFTIAENSCVISEELCFPGVIQNKGKEFYGFVSLTLHNSKLAFTTRQVSGVYYRFEGSFLQRPPFDNAPTDRAVLEGVLKKYVDGTLAVYAPVQFRPEAWGE